MNSCPLLKMDKTNLHSNHHNFCRWRRQLNIYVAMREMEQFLYSLRAGMTYQSYLTKLREIDSLEIPQNIWFFPCMDQCLPWINERYLIVLPLIKGKHVVLKEFEVLFCLGIEIHHLILSSIFHFLSQCPLDHMLSSIQLKIIMLSVFFS